eukprot:GHVN01039292.1.p1 GENE.GHVN01039292.1~~GHVN01039292.1.p1  ORF type:complete len:271 (+),score=37.80 GHVN01039292.1:51-863(+)
MVKPSTKKTSKIYSADADPEPVDKNIALEAARQHGKHHKKGWMRSEWGMVLMALAAIGLGLLVKQYMPQPVPEHLKKMVDPSNIGAMNGRSPEFSVAPVKMFTNWTLSDAASHLGGIFWTSQMERSIYPCESPEGLPGKMPEAFDARKKWPDCFNYEAYSMGECSSSWAIAAATTMSSRACIVDNSKAKVDLSPQVLLSCDPSAMGCKGGAIDSMWIHVEKEGLQPVECQPFTGRMTVGDFTNHKWQIKCPPSNVTVDCMTPLNDFSLMW